MEPIEFETHPELKDYYEAFHKMYPIATRNGVFGIVLLAVFVYLIATWDNSSLYGALTAAAFLLVVYSLTIAGCLLIQQPRRVMNISAPFFPVRFAISDDTLLVANKCSSGVMGWTTFKSWKESKNVLLIVTLSGMFYVIPRRSVPADRLDDLRSLLQRNIASTSPTTEQTVSRRA
ncbi:MAG TPA: YcxB family protein [Candidatus Baltobacteraceae bacterium]